MITSTQNAFVKDCLQTAKQKDVFVFDSIKLIEEAISAKVQVLHILKLESSNFVYSNEDVVVSQNVLNKFTNSISSQGVVAICKLCSKQICLPKGNFLVLENLQDPGNVGTLIRSAVGAGFLDVYLINCVRLSNDKLIRSTMGAFFKANLFEVNDSFYDVLKNSSANVVICDLDGQDLYKTQFDGNYGVVVGNEGNGISEKMKSIATQVVTIPMLNNLESLNAAVSGSVVMFQIANSKK